MTCRRPFKNMFAPTAVVEGLLFGHISFILHTCPLFIAQKNIVTATQCWGSEQHAEWNGDTNADLQLGMG